MRVVVVDDTEADLWFFSEVVRSRGHVAIACQTGEDAIDSIAGETPDVVLLDLLLPGMSGTEVCARVRELPEGDRPFVLVVTASDDPDALKAVLAVGADDFIRKPADADLLNIRLAIAERRVAAQEALRQAEAVFESKTRELETLFINVQDVFFSVDVTEARLIQASPATASIFGYGPQELAGDPQLWKSFLLPPHEGDPDPWSRLRERGVSEPIVSEYPVRTATGEERRVRMSVQVRPDHDRGGLRADGVVTDVTEEYRNRRQLAERNEELDALHRISQLALAAGGLDDVYEEILAVVTEVTGWPVAGIEEIRIGSERLTLAAARGVERDEDSPDGVPLRDWISEPAAGRGEIVERGDPATLQRYAGTAWLPADMKAYTAFPLGQGEHAFGALFLVHTEPVTLDDRTRRLTRSLVASAATHLDRLAAQEALSESESRYRVLAGQLRQANDELESFAYSVSHDLRAPLRTMQGFAHSLLQDYGARMPPEAGDFLRRIIASGRQSEQLISDLLAYSRLSFERMDLKHVDLGEVVDAALEQVHGDLSAAAGEVEVEVEGPLPTAVGHHPTLVQVVANLVSNAIKFVPPERSPRIRIRAEAGDHAVRLFVDDNGIGVPEGQEERIFKVFERLSQDGDRPGTGIGLAIVRRGAQRVGGRCGVDRRPEGGSAFWIELSADRRTGPRSRVRHV